MQFKIWKGCLGRNFALNTKSIHRHRPKHTTGTRTGQGTCTFLGTDSILTEWLMLNATDETLQFSFLESNYLDVLVTNTNVYLGVGTPNCLASKKFFLNLTEV